jgi:hypothetical protein
LYPHLDRNLEIVGELCGGVPGWFSGAETMLSTVGADKGNMTNTRAVELSQFNEIILYVLLNILYFHYCYEPYNYT